MLKIGVLELGHLGKIHIKCIRDIPEYQLVGFYDPVPENASLKVEEEHQIKVFASIADLLEKIDAVDIVTPYPITSRLCSNASLEGQASMFSLKSL